MERSGFRVAGSRGNSSPERGRATGREVAQPPPPPMRRVMKVLKKVQVVYYLTRNGQLEHPHFMEVSHLANQQLRLKDFIDRLILLRGRGMPSRSYKNGYVWNDLTENDIIHTSEGAEYILKGSEILHSSSEFSNKTPVAFMAETERLQQLQISEKRAQTIYNPIPKLKLNTSLINGDLDDLPKAPTKVEEESYPEETEDSVLNHKDDEEVEKRSFTSSNVPSCRCSRRTVSTEELQFVNGSTRKSSSELQNHSILADDHPSPQSTASTLSSEKGEMANNKGREPSRRFVVVEEEQEDSTVEMMNQGKSSVLLQLIACGGSVAAKGKSIPCLKQQMSRAEGRVVVNGGGGGGLHRGVVCKEAVAAAGKVVVMGEEEVMIKYMSENPRFGNLQSEEKEYFSGSILEAMDDQRRAQVEPVLKKSSSYKEESAILSFQAQRPLNWQLIRRWIKIKLVRSCKTGLGEASEETGEDHKVEKKAASSACGGKSICIPNPMRKHNKQQFKK
ncbi:hypothetical protein V2J09_021692 [Rumex salicifolius]